MRTGVFGYNWKTRTASRCNEDGWSEEWEERAVAAAESVEKKPVPWA